MFYNNEAVGVIDVFSPSFLLCSYSLIVLGVQKISAYPPQFIIINIIFIQELFCY